MFAAGLGGAGIGDDDVVVRLRRRRRGVRGPAGVDAAGHRPPAALLDGGLLGWEGPTSTTSPGARAPRCCTPRPWPQDLLVDLGAGRSAADEPCCSTPARASASRGANDPVDVRAGHVPGAVHLPARANVDARGRLLPDDVLRARLAEAGVDAGADVVSSCGSGVTACHTLLVLEHLGLPAGAAVARLVVAVRRHRPAARHRCADDGDLADPRPVPAAARCSAAG